jgi:hypothetical protein
MIFCLPYPTPYPEQHFEIGYSYPLDFVRSDVDTLKRFQRWIRCGNYPISLHPYVHVYTLYTCNIDTEIYFIYEI